MLFGPARMQLPTVRTPMMAQQYGTRIPTPPATRPTGMSPSDPVIGANPPGDPAASQNVVTACPYGYAMSSIGCVGQGGDSNVAPLPVVSDMACPAGMTLLASGGCTPTATGMPVTFPWLAFGLLVLGSVVGGIAGKHYNHPIAGASIGGVAALLGGAMSGAFGSLSVGG
jgi:hypothetical protein